MAPINNFLSHLDFEKIRDFCLANGETVRYAKGECFVETGECGRHAGFVQSGFFKYCVLTSKGDYATTGFSFRNEFVIDFTQSFLFNKPSKISIVAGKEADILQVPLQSLRDFITRQQPEFISTASSIVLEEAYTRYLSLHKSSPTERYLELLDSQPEILEYVPLRDIASYLLVTPVHLSRIRKSLETAITGHTQQDLKHP